MARTVDVIETFPFSRPIAFFSFSNRAVNLVIDGDNSFSSSSETSCLNLSKSATLSASFVKETISCLVSFLTSSLVRSAPINRISKISVTDFCSALVSLMPFV